jgi:hypothetical protein
MKTFDRRHGLPALALGCALGLGTFADTTRDAMPPPSPRFVRPAEPLFADDFHAGKLGPAWRPDQPGVWAIKRGMLKAELPDERQRHSVIYTGDSTWTDYALDFDVCGMRGVDKGAVVRVARGRGLGIDLRGPGYHDVRLQINEFPVGHANVENGNGVWQHVHLEVRGAHCRLDVNNETLVDRRLPLRLSPSGGIAFAAYTGGVGQCTVYYDNVIVQRLAPFPGDRAADRQR